MTVNLQTGDQRRTVEVELPEGWVQDDKEEDKIRFVHKEGMILDLFATKLRGLGKEARVKYVSHYKDVIAEYTSTLSAGSHYIYLYLPKGANPASSDSMTLLLNSINVRKPR